jgi:hypothetical protein
MTTPVEQAMHKYTAAYQKLYRQQPRNFHALDTRVAVMDGVPLEVAEIESLTARLEREYHQTMGKQRDNVVRLIGWCKED